jgi:hypothetical protein
MRRVLLSVFPPFQASPTPPPFFSVSFSTNLYLLGANLSRVLKLFCLNVENFGFNSNYSWQNCVYLKTFNLNVQKLTNQKILVLLSRTSPLRTISTQTGQRFIWRNEPNFRFSAKLLSLPRVESYAAIRNQVLDFDQMYLNVISQLFGTFSTFSDMP